MSKNVVIALNMQTNYFGRKGSNFLGEHALTQRVLIERYLAGLNKETVELYYSRDIRSPEDPFFSFAKTQCIVGTPDVHMLDGLVRGNALVFTTSRPSAAWLTPMVSEIRKHSPETVTLVGAETDSAVLFTAAELRFRGFRVIVPEALVVARDSYCHNFAIHVMADNLGVEVIGGVS